jgi:glucosyl-dolichyl phosphate glucuronosyltransferase
LISVIIPTRNRANLLASTLQSLTQQTLNIDQFEILIIDNGSTDNTYIISQEYSKKLVNIRYIYESEPGLHAGRHRGIREAVSDKLTFIDDDIEASPKWLESIVIAFQDPDVGMVGGNNLPMFLKPPPEWLIALWNRPFRKKIRAIPALSVIEVCGENTDFDPYLVWGCNFSIRKSILLKAGGFHPDGMPIDLIRFRGDGETHVSRFVKESGIKCVFHAGASVYHKVTPERMTFEYFHQRGFNQGISQSFTDLKNNKKRIYPNFDIKKILHAQWTKIFLDKNAKHAISEMHRGYSEGYAYHQRSYYEDEALRLWVQKSKYFDGDLV